VTPITRRHPPRKGRLKSPALRSKRKGADGRGGGIVTRALRSHGLWLTVTYVGILLLMARAYA